MSQHLTAAERGIIESGLLQGNSFAYIGKKLDRSPTTISREVRKRRAIVARSKNIYNDCLLNMTARNTARIMNLVSVLSWTNHPMYAMAVSLKRRVKKTMLTIRHIKRSVLMNTNYLQAERVSEQQ